MISVIHARRGTGHVITFIETPITEGRVPSYEEAVERKGALPHKSQTLVRFGQDYVFIDTDQLVFEEGKNMDITLRDLTSEQVLRIATSLPALLAGETKTAPPAATKASNGAANAKDKAEPKAATSLPKVNVAVPKKAAAAKGKAEAVEEEEEEEDEEEEEGEEEEEEEEEDGDGLPEEVVNAKKLRDVLEYLMDAEDITDPKKLKKRCNELKGEIPLLQRIADLDGRVDRTLEVMDSGEDAT